MSSGCPPTKTSVQKVLNGFPNGRSIGGVKFAVIVRCEWNFLQLTHADLDCVDSRLNGK